MELSTAELIWLRPDCMVKNAPDDMMTGRKNIAFITALPWNFCLSSSATKKLNTSTTGTVSSRSLTEPHSIRG